MVRARSIVLAAAFLFAAGCRSEPLPTPGSGGGQAAGPSAPASTGPIASGSPADLATAPAASASFTCKIVDGTTQTCAAADYCYAGIEAPSNYSQDPGVRFGCNPLPADCAAAPTCACVLAHYGGFCTCDDHSGIVLSCSLV